MNTSKIVKQKKSKVKRKRIELKEDLLDRILVARKKIVAAIHPVSTYMPFFIQHFPQMDTPKERSRIQMNWLLRKTDLDIITMMEELPELIKSN